MASRAAHGHVRAVADAVIDAMPREQRESARPCEEMEPASERVTVRSAVIQNAQAPRPLSAQELANVLGVERDRVHEAASRLRREGKIGRSRRQVTRAINVPATPGLPTPAPVLTEAELLEGLLTPHGRRKVLSRLAQSGPEPVQVSAIRALEEMDRQTGRQVGPPEPTGDPEHVARLARLVYCAGSEIGERAIEDARALWERDAPRATDADPGRHGDEHDADAQEHDDTGAASRDV